MSLKNLRGKRWFKILSNKYLLISIAFAIWMLFFDSNSWLVHRELNEEIHKLKNNEAFYREEIEHDHQILEQLDNEEGLEKYAREKYFMKRENEDIFIIETKDTNEKKKASSKME